MGGILTTVSQHGESTELLITSLLKKIQTSFQSRNGVTKLAAWNFQFYATGP